MPQYSNLLCMLQAWWIQLKCKLHRNSLEAVSCSALLGTETSQVSSSDKMSETQFIQHLSVSNAERQRDKDRKERSQVFLKISNYVYNTQGLDIHLTGTVTKNVE